MEKRMCSRPGTVVEVSSPDEGLSGARFEAVVIRPPSAKKRRREALVEYKTLLSDDASPAPLRELVNPSCLRPQPPEEAQDSFELHEAVDAFHDDGWWTGVVNAVLDQSYSVLFQNPSDQIQFKNSQLRPHLDWIDGKWVRPQKRSMEELFFSIGAEVEARLFGDMADNAWVPAKILEKKGNELILVECQSSENGTVDEGPIRTTDISDVRPPPPALDNQSYVLLNKVDAFFDFHWRCGVITKLLARKRYVVFFKDIDMTKEISHHDLRPHLEWTNGKWFVGQEILSTSGWQRWAGNDRSRVSKRARVTQNASSGTEVDNTPDGLKHSILGGPESEQNNIYKKRGRPRKIAVKSVQDSGLHCQEIRTSQQNDKVENSQSPVGHSSMEGTTENDKPLIQTTRGGKASPLVKCTDFFEGGERRHDDEMATEAGETNGAETGFMANALRDDTLASCSLSYHQPLSKQGYEDAHPPSTGGDPNGDATQDMSMTKKTGDTTPKAALPLGEAAADTQLHDSCVMKRSPLWKTIEAMEAFQALPQNPHFRPLLDCQEEIREGLAIGNMVAFASLVEKASHLRFDDPRSTLDSIFSGLAELVAHGFDVKPVQHRVNELLSLKLSSEQLTKQSEAVEARIRVHHQKKVEIDGEINEIERMMEELEMKRSEALAKRAAWDSGAGLLKSELDSIGEEMRLAALEFERRLAGL